EQRDVGPHTLRQLERFVGGYGLPDDGQVGLRFEQPAQAVAKYRVVVGDYDTYGAHRRMILFLRSRERNGDFDARSETGTRFDSDEGSDDPRTFANRSRALVLPLQRLV